MEIETVHHYDYGDFLEGNLELSEQSVELIGEADPKELNRDMQTFTWTGVGAILAGIGIMVATNLGLGLMEALPFLIAGGIAALGVGMMKGFSKVFGKKRLNLPRLQVRRKTHSNAKTEPTMVREFQQVSDMSRKQRRRWSLSKSSSDSVIMGVCGGLAKSSGINSSLIRLLFIAAFAITGGTAAVIYFLLGMFLPADDTPKIQPRQSRHNGDVPIR